VCEDYGKGDEAMSQETSEWLNTMTLIGYTDKRGNAWHYRESSQGVEPNHYPGPIPVEDVERRLFNFTAVSRPLYVAVPAAPETMTSVDDTGLPIRYVLLDDRQAIVADDDDSVLGVFKGGYQPHQYREWLLDHVATILHGGLAIGSAMLLQNRAVAAVTVELEDVVTVDTGGEPFAIRPHLLASTSLNGTLATDYRRVTTAVVCDNTLSVALSEKGTRVKRKHTRYSTLKANEIRDALSLVMATAEDASAEIQRLAAVDVSDATWRAFLDAHAPLPKEKGKALTMTEKRRDTLTRLWNHDTRVAPWRNTALGVVQAVNTYTHHEAIVRGADRAERNALRAVSGGVDMLDAETLATLDAVLTEESRFVFAAS